MKTKILALLLALCMLFSCFALIGCESDDGGEVTTDTTTTTTTTKGKTGTPKYTVTIVDDLTGLTIESTQASVGKKASFFTDFEHMYYGYKFDKAGYQAQLVASETDYTIHLKYEPQDLVYVTFYTLSAAPLTGFEYTFRERLTAEELAQKDPKDIKNGACSAVYKEETKTADKDGRIAVYVGGSIDPSKDFGNIAPKQMGYNFSKIMVADADKNYTETEFTGINITENMNVRLAYEEADAVLGIVKGVAGKQFSDLVASLTIANRDPLEIEAPTETDRSTRESIIDPNAYFNYASGMGEQYAWTETVTLKYGSGRGFFNKFTGADLYLAGNVYQQSDNNVYVSFDGSKLYMLILVRDDTVYGEKGSYVLNKQTYQYDHTSYFQKSNNFYGNSDNIEVRFYLGDDATKGHNDRMGCDTYPFTHTYNPITIENPLRCISVTREGNFTSYDPEPTTVQKDNADKTGKVAMCDYVTLKDLVPEDTTRKTLTLYDTNGKENGYGIGIEFDIKGYCDAIGYDFGEGKDFPMTYCITVIDQVKPIRQLMGQWILPESEEWLEYCGLTDSEMINAETCYRQQCQQTIPCGAQQWEFDFTYLTLFNGTL